MKWLSENYKWLFDGVAGAAVISVIGYVIHHFLGSQGRQQGAAALTAQGAKVTDSPVASGTNISQTINSPTVNLSLPAPSFGAPGRERYDEWRELVDEIHESIEQMWYAFVPLVAHKGGDERCDYQAGIRRGNRVLRNRILIAEAIQKSGLIQDWDELVRYAHSGRGPRDRWEEGSPTMGGFETKARTFQEKLMQVAREDVLASTAAPYLSAKTYGHEVPRCEFWLEFDESDLFEDRSLRIQNTGNEAAFDVVVKIPADGSGFKSDIINRLDNDKSWVPCTSNGNPEYLRSLRAVLAETVLHHSGEGDLQTIPVLISCRTRMKQSCECRLEIRLPLRGGIQFAIPANHSEQEVPKQRAATQQGVEVEVAEVSASEQQGGGTEADRKFARLAIDEARKSVPENDGRTHPWVGAVVVKDGKVLGTAHRGEVPGNHAEFVALERNLSDVAVAGATVYTTLEPCTTRNPPKIPCVDRLIERRVARVVIGILDPDDRIRGKGQRKLSNAGIETALFPHDLAMEVEELNREFTRFCEQRRLNLSLPTTDDQSSWPDVILECQWPSLVYESKIPGSHTVRKRPWILRYRGPGAVYDVRVHRIDFGAFKALFPFPVRTLTDTASVYPIICRIYREVINPDDLESLIRNPPSGCDVQQYAVKTDGNEGEEIFEVEIPVYVSYDDKNGNQFRIKYLLNYDTHMREGEMIRIGRIEKVAPK